MPEENTATLEAPEQETFIANALRTFELNQPQPVAPEKKPAEPAKPQTPAAPAKPAEEKKPAVPKTDSQFPEEMLTGKKEVAAKAEPNEDEKLLAAEPPANLSEKSKVNFKALQSAAGRKIDALTKELGELRTFKETSTAKAPAEDLSVKLKAEQEQRAQLEAQLERVSFEHSPKFQQFVKGESEELTSAKSYLEGTEVNPNVVELASRVTGAARLKVLRDADIDRDTIAALSPHLARVDSIRRERDGALGDWKATNTEWQAEQKRQQEQTVARQKADEDRIFTEVGAKVAEKFEPFQKVEGQEKWNAQVEQLNADARKFFNGEMNLEQLGEIAYYGVGAKVIHQMFHTLREKYNALSEEHAALKSAQPEGGSTRKTALDTPPADETLEQAGLRVFEANRVH